MKRAGWEVDLAQFLTAHARAPYQPGQFDCIILAGSARAIVTGEDLITDRIGTYRTVEGGLAICRGLGFADHIAAATQGLVSIPVAFAQPGDLVEVDGIDGLPAMGVVGGEHVYVVGRAGIEVVELLVARKAWRL